MPLAFRQALQPLMCSADGAGHPFLPVFFHEEHARQQRQEAPGVLQRHRYVWKEFVDIPRDILQDVEHQTVSSILAHPLRQFRDGHQGEGDDQRTEIDQQAAQEYPPYAISIFLAQLIDSSPVPFQFVNVSASQTIDNHKDEERQREEKEAM